MSELVPCNGDYAVDPAIQFDRQILVLAFSIVPQLGDVIPQKGEFKGESLAEMNDLDEALGEAKALGALEDI